ncbi:MAG: CinA family nicotinamide mononucleotide deamidase-related protein [Candidatus Marinimicrobia bacterium]|nr:CinA family nicotinamide mononucleotide deamidase-related protein [Candidatus Neomarinimicrobiota bacterium]
MKAAIINIGSELTAGIIENTNSTYIASLLSSRGIDVNEIITIPDNVEKIVYYLEKCSGNSDITLVTGGLGPTLDDCTRQAVSKFLNKGFVYNEDIARKIKERFEKRGIDLPECNLKQAFQIEGVEILDNPIGTAPGMRFEKEGAVFFICPGVPAEMVSMIQKYVLPYIDGKVRDRRITKTIKTFGIPESKIYELIKTDMENCPNVKVSFLPQFTSNDILLSVKESNKSELEKLVTAIKNKLGDSIFSENGEPIEVVIGKLLRNKNKTIAVAESCTGGLVGDRITTVPGSSDYYIGGIISYSNEVKIRQLGVKRTFIEKYGAVSEEVAIEMARGVKKVLGSDIGISTTGIAGPTGGSEKKPVGTVYVGYSDFKGDLAKRFYFNVNRQLNKAMFSQFCLNLLRLKLLEER